MFIRLLNDLFSVQTTVTFFAAACLSGATPPPGHVLSRSVGWQVRVEIVYFIAYQYEVMSY